MERRAKKLISYVMPLLLIFSLIFPGFFAGTAQAATMTKWVTFKYDNFSNSSLNSLLQINGNSFVNGSVLRLTPAIGSQAGSVFNKNMIYNNGNHYSFSTFFGFQFTGKGTSNSSVFAPGADGITFAIQTASSQAGGSGSGIGIGGVQPSIAVKFDTFQNGPTLGNLHDPSDNYIGLALNGDVDNTNPSRYTAISKTSYDMKDGTVHYAWIDYDGSAKTMSVYISNTTTRPATAALVTPNVDLDSIFNGSVGIYAGFTSATGKAWENHDILQWYFNNNLDPIDTANNNYTYQQAPASVTVTTAAYGQPGKTQLTATAKDANGNPVAGAPLTFKTDSGTIEDLNGNPITPVPAVINSDSNGQAQVLLDMGLTPNASPGNVTAIAVGGAYSALAIPPTPTNLGTSNATSTGATLTWNPVAGISSYKVYDNGTPLTTVTGTTYNVTGLAEGTTHTYTVTAVNNNLQSAPSASVNVSTPVPTLTVTTSLGTGPSTTKVTATAGPGNRLVTKVSSGIIPTPNAGDPVPTGAGVTDPYTSGSDITGVDAITNKYIGVYEVDSNNKVVSFKLITLTGSDITTAAPTLTVTPSPGTGPSTTKVTATAGPGNRLVTKVSSGIIPTPNAGDPVPTGAGVTDPYSSGSDIVGVDATTNKYIGVYEVDSNNKVVSFKLITLTGSDITTTAESIVDLLADPSNGVLQVGTTQTVVIKAVYSDQSVVDVTYKTSFNTSNPTVATVVYGVVTGKANGTAMITASYGGKSASATFLVQSGTPDISLSLEASPDSVVGDGKSQITLKASVVSINNGSPVKGKTITFQGFGISTQTAVTDETGTATMTFIVPLISGVTPVHNTITASAVDSKGLMAQKSISVHYMPASVQGVTIDKVTGKPIAGAIVAVSADFNGDGIVDFSQQVTTGADGTYQIFVPRGNWDYTVNIQTPVLIGNQTVMLNRTQTAQVGTLNGTGQTFASANKISGQLLISSPAFNNSNSQPTIGSMFGTGNVSAIVQGTNGNNYNSQITIDANGNFDVNNVPQGQYQITYQIKAPDGTTLAGPSVTVNVDQNGEMGVVYSLIDPYGVVTDAATGQPINGVTMSLYWADTELNKQNGHTPNTLVSLPELSSFAPNQNRNPQVTNSAGEYAWMVFPNADYYIVATKSGYDSFSTLATQTNVSATNGSDSYIQNGIIHVGQTMVSFSFTLQQQNQQSSSGSSNVVSSGNMPTGLKTSDITSTSVTLSWDAMSGAASYNIYDNGQFIASNVTGTSYQVTGLTPGSSHTFTISAVVGGKETKQSVSQSITTAVANMSSVPQTGHHEKYIEGYSDRTFRPEREVTREEVAAMLFRLYHLSKSGLDVMTYSDVSNEDWGAEEIAAVTKAGIMNGYPDGTFRPNQPITREEMAGIVARLKHLQGRGKDAFSDIFDSWARDAINSATEAGILKGYADGTFRPKANTTRAEVITMMNRLTNRSPLTRVTPTWSDVGLSYWAYGDIEEASIDHD
ncbi:S-layer homology domain-containing protein, partial [Gordoniibacillus kamchatkensis]|uniref:S-layer homology domain-containing protein n=1 Tax=Gordoniibacillus kamchatkensis TaxID=1590651 RepID=UPI000597E117